MVLSDYLKMLEVLFSMENLNFDLDFEFDFNAIQMDMDFDDSYTPDYVEEEDPFYIKYHHEDVELMWNDICRLHTELVDGTPGEHCVEIRPIMRKANVKGKHDVAIKHFHMWRADAVTKQSFIDWVSNDLKNQGCCIFISVYCFDAALKTYKENGKPNRPYTVNKQNQLYTRWMVADFDNVSEDENKFFDDTMDNLGIPFQSIQTSEKGYQKRIYLADQVNDDAALSKFTKLLINKGFKADKKVINKGQVVRVVGTVNNKVFSPKYPDRNVQFPVTVVRDTTDKISFNDLWTKISSLPDIYPKYKTELLTVKQISEIKKEEFKPIAYYNEDIFIEQYKDIIPEHYIDNIQKPIRYMLIDTPDGFTDAVVMFIIPYFKNTLKLSYEQVKPIMMKWAEINNYAESDKYERIYYTEYKKGFGAYTSELQERYGSIAFHKNYDTVIKINDNTSNLKPIIFNKNIYPELDKTALKVFIGFLFEYKASDKLTWEFSEVMSYNNISKPTATKALKELISKEFISCKTYYKGSGKENDYTLLKTYIALKTERRIEFTLSELDRMFSKLKGNEIKVFIYMKYIVLKSSDGIYFGNQWEIAKEIGIERSRISRILNDLKKKRFLNIDKIKTADGFESNSYTLII